MKTCKWLIVKDDNGYPLHFYTQCKKKVNVGKVRAIYTKMKYCPFCGGKLIDIGEGLTWKKKP